MTDPDDFLLSELFQDADTDNLGSSQAAFAQIVMARVVETQVKRKALIDSLRLAALASVATILIVMVPSAWPQLEASWIQCTATFGLDGQSLMLIATLLLSGIGWAVAVKD